MSWRIQRVREMATLFNGHPFDSSTFEDEGDVPLVRIRDLSASDFETHVPSASVPNNVLLRDGDVVIGMDGDFEAIVWRRGPAALNQRLCALRENGSSDVRFLAYALPPHLEAINDLTYSTTVKHLSSWQVQHIALPAPDLDVQRAIADFLDRETAKIDALIEKQNEMIGLLQERRQHVIAGALQASDGAPAVPLKRALVRIQQGISPDTSSGTEDADVWVLKTGATNHGVFDENESKPVPADVVVPPGIEVRVGDLLVSRASGSPDLVGSAAIVRALGRRAILSDKTFRLVPSPYEALPRFLYWFLNSPSYRSQVRLAISGADGLANNLPLSSLRRMRLQLPPLQDQQVIAASLDRETAKIDALIAKAEEFVALAQERRAALITAAVTGQIDVLGEAG